MPRLPRPLVLVPALVRAPGRRLRLWLHLPVLVIGGLLATCPPVHADPGLVGRVAEARGEFALRHADGEVLDSPHGRDLRNSPVLQGDRVRTGWKARAELDLGEGRLRLGEDTEILVRQLDDAHADIVLERGQVALEVRREWAARHWRIETAAGLHLPNGAGLFRIEAPTRRHDLTGASATAWRSALRIVTDEGSILLPAGRRVEIDRDQQWSMGLPAADGFARWAMDSQSGGWEPPPRWAVTPERYPPDPPAPPPPYWEPSGPGRAPVIVMPPIVIERAPEHGWHVPAPPPRHQPRPPVVVMPSQPMPAYPPHGQPAEPRGHLRQPPPAPPAPAIQPMPQSPRAQAPVELPARPDRRHHEGGERQPDNSVRPQPPGPTASAPGGGRSPRAF